MASRRFPNALRRVQLVNNQLRWATSSSEPPRPDIEAILAEKKEWDKFPDDVQRLAVFAEHARAGNYQIPQLSKANPNLDAAKAYEITAAIRLLRETTNGEVVKGRKLGLTNRANWAAAGADRPFWSYMYQSTIVDLPPRDTISRSAEITADLSHINALEPRVEPEIVVALARPIRAAMSDIEILGCIDWIAHGFEIVGSIFPGWKSTPLDSTAAFGMHQLLLAGPRIALQSYYEKHAVSPEALLDSFKNCTVELQHNGTTVQTGRGSDVLDSPINALRSLAELLEADSCNPPLAAGEIITTGTMTAAPQIGNGDLFATKLSGIHLPDLEVRFRLR